MRWKLLITFLALFMMGSYVSAREVVFVTDPGFVPFAFKEGNKMVGFEVELIDEVAKEMGVDYRLEGIDLTGVIPGVQAGKFDIAMAGIIILEERKKLVDFSIPYYDSGILIMVREDSDIKTAEDVAHRKIGLKIGTSSTPLVEKKYPDAPVTPYPNSDNAILDLLAGRIDAFIYDEPNILYFANTAGKGKVRVIGPRMFASQYGAVLPKGSPYLDSINAALKKLMENGTYDRLYTKWFGENGKFE